MTRTSALIIAGQDIRRYHFGVRAHSRTTAAGLLPVSLLAQQRLTEPVELGDHLLRRRSNSLTGPFAQLLKLPGDLSPDLSGHLVGRQGTCLLPGLTDRGAQILGRGVGFADHLTALAHRRFQPVQFTHGILLAPRLSPAAPIPHGDTPAP